MTFPAEINLEDLDGTDGFSVTGLVGGGFRFGDGLGSAVASLGDVNGDGFDDFIIGVPQADPGDPARENAGVSYVIFGRDTSVDGNFDADFSLSDLDGTNGFAINGAAAGDYLGASVAGVGDVNGDGIADIAVGAPGGDPGGREGAGETYIIFGKDTEADGDFAAAIKVSDLDGTDGFVINGVDGAPPPPGDGSGSAVSSAGDVNGDGIDDILIGAPLADEPGSSIIGEAYVVFGKDTAEDGDFASSIELSSLDGTNGFTIPGLDFQDTAGSSVSGGGDINNDGVDDIVVSAPRADNDDVSEGDNAGETYVIFGKDTSEDGDFDATVDLEALGGSNGFILTGTELADFS